MGILWGDTGPMSPGLWPARPLQTDRNCLPLGTLAASEPSAPSCCARSATYLRHVREVRLPPESLDKHGDLCGEQVWAITGTLSPGPCALGEEEAHKAESWAPERIPGCPGVPKHGVILASGGLLSLCVPLLFTGRKKWGWGLPSAHPSPESAASLSFFLCSPPLSHPLWALPAWPCPVSKWWKQGVQREMDTAGV